jgi:hypothetical protein
VGRVRRDDGPRHFRPARVLYFLGFFVVGELCRRFYGLSFLTRAAHIIFEFQRILLMGLELNLVN